MARMLFEVQVSKVKLSEYALQVFKSLSEHILKV